jgi:hypothetical protein
VRPMEDRYLLDRVCPAILLLLLLLMNKKRSPKSHFQIVT